MSRLPDRILFTGQQLSAGQHLVYRTTSRLPHNISFAGQHLVCWKIFHYFFCFWLLTSKSAKNFILYVQKECKFSFIQMLHFRYALVSGFKIYSGKQDFAPRKVLNRYDDFHVIILRGFVHGWYLVLYISLWFSQYIFTRFCLINLGPKRLEGLWSKQNAQRTRVSTKGSKD